MNKLTILSLWGLCFCLALFVFAGASDAFYLDKDRTFNLSGKLQTRASFRTADSEGFTFAQADTGDLVQHRNLLYIEAHHDLRKISWPGDFRVKYHLRARFMFEGLYDYGPSQFKDLPDDNWVKSIDNFRQDVDLWEGYADISQGPLFFRLGKQNLSWGETDVFRLLDNINPLDNTFGGPFEDLDDRRIPSPWKASGYRGVLRPKFHPLRLLEHPMPCPFHPYRSILSLMFQALFLQMNACVNRMTICPIAAGDCGFRACWETT